MNHHLDYAQTWLNRLRNHLQARSYSQNTCDNYCDAVAFFLQAFPGHPNQVTGLQVQSYLLGLKIHHHLKETTINLQLDGIRYFYNHIVQKPEILKDVNRMKEKLVLPTVFSAQEVHRILSMTTNKKHQLILALAYGSGLRLSELVGLQTCDIDFEREIVMVRNGKGGKDRVVMLPKQFCEMIKVYIQLHQPQKALFESDLGGPLNKRTVQAIFKHACKRAKIERKTGIHSLRHSFATHLLESGTDIRYIQALLGHSSTKTTERYTHVATQHIAKLVSPLDRMKL
jgi:integrase/recombinase XerD